MLFVLFWCLVTPTRANPSSDEERLLDAESAVQDEDLSPDLLDDADLLEEVSSTPSQPTTTRVVAEVPLRGVPGLPMAEAVDVALHRAGVTMAPLALRRRMLRAALTPRVVVDGWRRLRWVEQSDTTQRPVPRSVPRSVHRSVRWGGGVSLCFGACDPLTQTADVPELAVVGGQVFVTGEEMAGFSPAAARVASSIAAYRAWITEEVVALYRIRARLLAMSLWSKSSEASLRERLDVRLDLDENQALLDVFTDGCFSEALIISR